MVVPLPHYLINSIPLPRSPARPLSSSLTSKLHSINQSKMHALHFFAPPLQFPNLSQSRLSRQFNHYSPLTTSVLPAKPHFQPNQNLYIAKSSRSERTESTDFWTQIKEEDNDDVPDIDYEEEEKDEIPAWRRFRESGKEEQVDYDRNPEFAEIIGSCLDDPQKARSKMEERLRRKRNNILQIKTGSATPMKVIFNKFDFSNSYVWIEFYNSPLEKDVSLICDAIRAWHIVGRLGGCNSLNMQLSQSPMDKRPIYDAIQGANVNPTTFYNIGDLEIQDNLARIWVDIGTSEALLLDILVNALTQISSDYVGIKQVVFGGSEFESWRENLTSEDAGYSVHKI